MKADWVLLGGAVNEFAHCKRCGQGLDLGGKPQPIDLMTAILGTFIKLHAKCKPNWTEPEIKTPHDWIRSRDIGISSCTIWSVMTHSGTPMSRHDVPHDPDDFGRCYRLLERFPDWLSRLPEVAERHPEWTRIIAQWHTLCGLYEQKQFKELYEAIIDATRATDPDDAAAGGGGKP